MREVAKSSDDLPSEKLVIRLRDRIIRGYLEINHGTSIEDIVGHASASLPNALFIRPEGSREVEKIDIGDAKAIFFVREFEGDSRRKDLHFAKMAPIVHGIWIRIEFLDGEVMEGIVHNTIHHLVNPGFFLQPTDPEGNNLLVYIFKSQIRDYRVLGLRKLPNHSAA